MNDFYTEQLVKKKTDTKDIAIKALLVLLTVLAVVIVFFIPLGIILPVAMLVVDALVFRRMDVEYEYLYVNGELDIDKIMYKSKRKTIFSANVSDMEILAPVGDLELRQYGDAKVSDYSSKEPGKKCYAMVVLEKGQKKKIIFEPNETIVQGIRMLAPRKVVQ